MKETKINELIPDDKNFNEGTQYGQHLIEESLRKFGAGRSVLIDKNNRIIAGNKTIENAAAIGLEDVIVVETTGDKIVAVKRTDVDLDSKEGREMALADNATGMVNLRWDEAAIAEAQAAFGIAPREWGVNEIKFTQDTTIIDSGDYFDGSNLPIELQGKNIEADDLEKLKGDDITQMERVIIVYPKSRTSELASILGLEEIDKVVYKLDEINHNK